MKKIISVCVSILILILSCFLVVIIYANDNVESDYPTIFVENMDAAPGEQVKVNVNVQNNPGIAGAILRVNYDSKLILTGAENGEKFQDLNFTEPGSLSNPSIFLWDSESGQINDDGTLLTLTFKVSEKADLNENLNIDVSYFTGEIYNEKLEDLDFYVINGCITTKKYTIGDVNGNNIIDVEDASCIQMHVAKINEFSDEFLLSADTNNDGIINVLDATTIQKYIAHIISSFENGELPTEPSVDIPDDNSHTVIFKDYNGNTIKIENVVHGESATAPLPPQLDEYVFVSWDKTFDKITSDLVVTAQYEKISDPTIYVQNVQASAGETVQVPIKIYNNLGVNGMQLSVLYDSNISLIEAENGTALSTLYFTIPGIYSNPSKFLWDGISENDYGDGTILNLTFNIPNDAKTGDEYMIKLEYTDGSIYDSDLNNVDFNIINGLIKIK